MKRVALGLVMIGLVGGLAGGLAHAADGGGWGHVDMEKLAAGYKGMQDLNLQFEAFQAQQEAEIERYRKIFMLSDQERQEYLDLSTAAAPTEARDKRMKELEELSNQRERRLSDLRGRESRTAEEEKEYQQLTAISDKRVPELKALLDARDKALESKYTELSKIITESVDAAIKAVAEEQKLTIVLRKEIVLWGGSDITEAVVAKLNAPAPAAK